MPRHDRTASSLFHAFTTGKSTMGILHKPFQQRTVWQLAPLMALVLLLSGCGINNIPTYDEKVTSAWSQVENQYQRRADLIPNLVETVKASRLRSKTP
jgi:hypothetical protein